MLSAFYELLDRLDRAQQGMLFRIITSIIGVALIITAYFLTTSDHAQFLPAAYQENLISTTLIALFVVLSVIWLDRTLTALAVIVIALPLYFLFHITGQSAWAQMILGIAGMTLLLTVSLQLLRRIFSLPTPAFAIARLVLDEAIRLKIALLFIIAVIVLIPLLAATLDPTEALRYRIQTFLSYGTGTSYGMLAVMTLFLSTATVAFDQRDKTIFQIVSKPVSRLEYIIGKWIGVMGLNAILILIVSGSIFWFVQYMRVLPAENSFDRLAVSEQVLTARIGVKPEIDFDLQHIKQQVDETIKMSPEVDDTDQARQQIFKRLLTEANTKARTINPGQSREFVFKNVKPLSKTILRVVSPGDRIELSDPVKSVFDITVWDETEKIQYAPGVHYLIDNTGNDKKNAAVFIVPQDQQKNSQSPITTNQRIKIKYFPANALTLRFKINSGDNNPAIHFPLTIGIIGTPFFEVREVALVQMQTMLIPAGTVSPDGTLTVGIINGDINTKTGYPASVTFPPDGLEVMYKVSTFEQNYLRAMIIDWLKLGFLAMLGIAAATFASFPVACLLAFGVYFGAQTAPYLAESIDYYRTIDLKTNQTIWIKWVIVKVATAVHFILQGFEQVRPTDRLIDGRNIPWADVSTVFLTITLLWTGVTGLIGWIIFRMRQLAIYSGHS